MENTLVSQTIKQKVNKALQLSEEIIVKDKESLSGAIDLLDKIKTTGKIITKTKEKITKPLNEALKNARNIFRPIESNYLQAEKNVKKKILDYSLIEEKKRKEQSKKIANRVEKGTMKMETAVEKMDNLPEVSNKGETGKVQYRTIQKITIFDVNKIPRAYLIPDNGKIKKDILAGKSIAGIKLVEEKVLAVC